MQTGVGAGIDWFGSQLPSGGSKQGEQFTRFATNIVVILPRWLSLRLPTGAGVGHPLRGTCLIFTPQRQPDPLCQQVGSLNHRFFCCV
jgi:hypothetical protein